MATVSYQYKVVRPEFNMDGGNGDQNQPDLAVLANGDFRLINVTPVHGSIDFITSNGNGGGGSFVNLDGVSSDPAIAALSNGEYVTVGVNSQAVGSAGGTSILFGVDAPPLPGASHILGNQPDDQSAPAVAGLTGDRWVAVWTDQVIVGTPGGLQVTSDIRMSVLNNAGTILVKNDVGVAEFPGNQRNAAVAALSTGGFVATWTDEFFSSVAVPFIMARRYDSEGNAVGDFIFADTVGFNDHSDVVGLDNGGFAIVSFDTDSGSAGISLRIFNAGGVAVGSRINVSTGNGNSDPSIVKMSNGALTVSWTHNVSGTNNDLYMRSFSADGVALTGEFRYQGTDIDAINQRDAAIAAGANGRIVAAWTDDEVTDSGGTHIGGATYEFQRYTVGDDTGETLVGDSLWNFINALGGNDFLHANTYGPDGLMKAGAGDSVFYGDLGNDGLFGGDGDDDLYGGDGNDGLVGAAGDDYLGGDAGVDFLFGGAFGGGGARLSGSGRDTLVGGAGNDGLYGFDGADTIHGDAGNDYVEGGAGNDVINGGADSDFLLGEDGEDTINGGLGFDYMYGGSGADAFIFRKSDSADWILDFKAGEGDKLRLPDFGYANFAAIPLVDLSTPGNPAVQLTVTSGGATDQLTIFGVTLAQLNATNVLVA